MYAITKLSANSQAFVAQMSSLNLSRSNTVSLALAKALTFCVQLPSTEVTDIEAFFRTQIQLGIEAKIAAINELIVLDVKSVQDYALKFYKMRYQAAHPTCHVFSFNKETAIEDFFGITRVFDSLTLNVIKENPGDLASYINKFKAIVEELDCTPNQGL